MQKPIFGRTVNQVSSSLSKIIVWVWFLTTKIFYNQISHQLCTVKLDGLDEYEFYWMVANFVRICIVNLLRPAYYQTDIEGIIKLISKYFWLETLCFINQIIRTISYNGDIIYCLIFSVVHISHIIL